MFELICMCSNFKLTPLTAGLEKNRNDCLLAIIISTRDGMYLSDKFKIQMSDFNLNTMILSQLFHSGKFFFLF